MADFTRDNGVELLGRAVKHLNLRFPVAEIFKRTGYSKGNVSKFLSGKVKPSKAFLEKFQDCFHIDLADFSNSGNPGVSDIDVVNEYELTYQTNKNGNQFIKMPNDKWMLTVQLVPVKAYARYISEISDGIAIDDYTEIHFVVDQYGRGNYMAFEIKGDSMDNGGLYDNPDKAVVLGRELGRQHWKDGFRDSMYGWIIVHRDTILCKDIISEDMDAGTIICHSRNKSPEYSDFLVNLDEVVKIFKIIKRTF